MNNSFTKNGVLLIVGILLLGVGIFLGMSFSIKETPAVISYHATTTQEATSTQAIEGTPIPCPPGGIPCTIAIPIMTPGIVPLPPQDILLVGQATTTTRPGLRNDIFIGDTQTYPNSTARYHFMPYPGDVTIKSAYFLLPDFYSIPDQGYQSDPYVVSADGTKNIILHLRHQNNVSTDTDATITIQSPIVTTDVDHSMTLVESTIPSSVFSLVQNGKEALIEVTYTPKGVLTEKEAEYARQKLDETILNSRIYW